MPTQTALSYEIFIEGQRSPVTKAAHSYALSKYMKHLNIENSDDLLKYQENPKFIQKQIINYLITLKNPPHSLRYATRSQYLAAIMTFYQLNDVTLNGNLAKKSGPLRIGDIQLKKSPGCLNLAMREFKLSSYFWHQPG